MVPRPTYQAPSQVRIKELARSLGEELSTEAAAALVQFGALFLKWNARINMGGAIDSEQLVNRHYADAFAAARFIAPGTEVVDIGSGGGLPIIPMALVRTASQFDLFEPTGKKVAFLRTSVRELGLGDRVRIHEARMEGLGQSEFDHRFDVACSRATFRVAEWLEIGRTLIRSGGQVLVFGTGEEDLGLPPPSQERVYAPDRRILVF